MNIDMTEADHRRLVKLYQLFIQGIELDEAEQQALLEIECADDAVLCDQLAKLFDADRKNTKEGR